jgi:hypothetical protein
MRESERAVLVADVRARGVQEPIRVQRGGLVLDGRERLDAARRRGDTTIPAVVVDLDDDQKSDYVHAAAATRRHLSDDQLAAMEARFKAGRLPRERSERARKAGRAGGRGRPKRAADSPAHTPSPELSPAGAVEVPPPGLEPAATGTEQIRSHDADTETPTARKPPARWDEETGRHKNIPVRKLRRALDLERQAPELLDRVIQGDLTLLAAGKQLPTPPPGKTAAARARTKKAGKGAGPKPQRTRAGLLLPLTTSATDARTALEKYFGADWLGELARGVTPPPKAAESPDPAGAAPAAATPSPAPDVAGQQATSKNSLAPDPSGNA